MARKKVVEQRPPVEERQWTLTDVGMMLEAHFAVASVMALTTVRDYTKRVVLRAVLENGQSFYVTVEPSAWLGRDVTIDREI